MKWSEANVTKDFDMSRRTHSDLRFACQKLFHFLNSRPSSHKRVASVWLSNRKRALRVQIFAVERCGDVPKQEVADPRYLNKSGNTRRDSAKVQYNAH